jgi:hypothetical protein
MPVGLAHCGTEMLSLVALRTPACRVEPRLDSELLISPSDIWRSRKMARPIFVPKWVVAPSGAKRETGPCRSFSCRSFRSV